MQATETFFLNYISTESRLVVVRGQRGGKWEMTPSRHRVSLWGDEDMLKLDSADGCTTV